MAKSNSIYISGLEGIKELSAIGSGLWFVKSKEAIFAHLVRDMYSRTLKMFEYENFPETFSPWAFEMALQEQGYCIVANVTPPNGKTPGVYALRGVGLGGELDSRYLPTRAVGASPYLDITIDDELTSDKIVWAWGDSALMGLSNINALYAGLLADAFITLRLKLVLHRAPSFAVAYNEDEKRDAESFLKKLDDGELGIIGSQKAIENFVGNEGFSTKPNLGDGTNSIKEIIESIQYLFAQWFIKSGLNDNYNMKREALNSTETSANEDTLFPFIEDMLKCRQKDVEEINSKFGTSGRVKLAGQWARIFKKRDLSEKAQEVALKTAEEAPKDETKKEEVKEDE